MNTNKIIKSMALTSLVAVGITACNPFQADSMESGYENSASNTTSKEDTTEVQNLETEDAKLNEGSCGGHASMPTKDMEAKCGEGTCGGDMSHTDKKADAKCGEGKCGEGKCGGHN